MPRQLEKYLLPAGLAGALLLLAAIAIVSVRHIDTLIESGRRVNLTHAVIGKSSRHSRPCRMPRPGSAAF